MKKSRLLATLIGFVLCFLPSPILAQEVGEEEEIEFSVDWGDPTPGGPGNSKTPILVPHLWQNGYLC